MRSTRNRSRRYKKENQDLSKELLSLTDAIDKVRSFKSVKFDQTIECVLNLGIDPRQSDQLVRGSVSLPYGIGRQKKVVAFCEDSDIEEAKKAGAIEAGCDELVKKIEAGWLDFDVAVASTRVMGKVGKLGRTLGPQGKMPSPKNGTVTTELPKAIREFAAGKVEFRNDSGGNVHAVVGKQSFEPKKLIGNINSFIEHIKKIKPAGAKGLYIKKVCISATMSPAVKVAL